MNRQQVYPEYIARDEERKIQQEIDAVKSDRRSRTLLLYGHGGVGKTSLIRHMASENSDPATVWLEPVDVDDPECWLLSNLERKVVHQLDSANRYFGPYQQKLLEMPDYTRANISHETVVSYLGRVKEVFADCYEGYVAEERKTVVVTFDTVETIRGTNLLLTLTQWIKALPAATLFILSGRPDGGAADGAPGTLGKDPIVTELESRHHGIPVSSVNVRGLTQAGASSYLENSAIAAGLEGQEKEKLVHLSYGHPLWLAFLVDYLRREDVPDEARQHSLEYIEANLPYDGDPTEAGRTLHEDFLRRLVAPYQATDFWHEAFKRLAVVRQPIARPVWHRLMSDCPLPPDANGDHGVAWQLLLDTPWVRQRGGGRYVALHDAVAEAFAERLFPLHDSSGVWRRGIWQQAQRIYQALLGEAEAELRPDLAALDEDLRPFDTSQPREESASELIPAALIDRSMTTDARRRELDQWKAARLYYLFLCDFESGCEQLLKYFEEAETKHDTFFQDLLLLYLQRFLPGGAPPSAFNDVVRKKLEEFREWLVNQRPSQYIRIGLMVATYLIESGQPEAALKMIDRLHVPDIDHRLLHRVHILRGDAFMRIPARVKEALPEFAYALAQAEAVDPPDRHRLLAEAFKEQGYYHRNIGQWDEANLSYQHARDAMSALPPAMRSAKDREEVASIHTNWAYVKGLTGSYRDGLELVESAINVRHALRNPENEGLSWSVCGEVYRYARRFQRAWEAYSSAEELLLERRNWGRLGFVYQEQAICLFQADVDGIKLSEEPMGDAKARITRALDICVTHAVRGYPSALNRAGRIFGHDDPGEGLEYLGQGITEARRLSDGWFWFANVIEYAELLYRMWTGDGSPQIRAQLDDFADEVQLLDEEYRFPDLSGRWSLLQAHLAFSDYEENDDLTRLETALDCYQTGFANIAMRHVGSSGAASVRREFGAFRDNFKRLPAHIQEEWQARLRSAWTPLTEGSTRLLARLEELY